MEKGEEDQRPDSPEPTIQFIEDENKEKKKEDRLALLMKIVKANGQSMPYGRVNEELIQNLLRQIAGITPLVTSVLNDQDALLEFEGDVIVTSVCRALQGPREWEGEELDICCMAGEKYHLIEIEKSREEFRMKQEELRGERQQLEEQERVAKEQLELQSSHSRCHEATNGRPLEAQGRTPESGAKRSREGPQTHQTTRISKVLGR